MPRLPTFDLSAAPYAAVMDSFGGEDGYRSWLSQQIQDRAVTAELQALAEEQNTQRQERLAEVTEKLAEVREKDPLAEPEGT